MPPEAHWTWCMFVEHAEEFARLFFREEMMLKGREQARQLKEIFHRFGVPDNGRVLDLCCGVGRHAIPLAEMGYSVVGVDLSEAYIQRARDLAAEKGLSGRAWFLIGDARRLPALLPAGGPLFDAVLNLGTAVGYFGEEGDVAMLSGARSLAEEGALLVVDTVNRDWIVANFQPSHIVSLGQYEVHELREIDLLSSHLRVRWRFCERKEGYLEVRADVDTEIRLYSPHELLDLLRRSGWEPLGLYADLSLGELKPLSRRLVALARAA